MNTVLIFGPKDGERIPENAWTSNPLLDLNHCRKPQKGIDENYGITDWARKAKAMPFSVSPSSETMMLHET